MRKRTAIIASIIWGCIFVSCIEQSPSRNPQKCFNLLQKAEKSDILIESAPLINYQFGLLSEEFDDEEELRCQKEIDIFKKEDKIYYRFYFNDNVYVGWIMTTLVKSADPIQNYSIVFDKNMRRDEQKMELLKDIKRYFKKYNYAACIVGNDEEHHYWTKDNLVIEYRMFPSHAILEFCNAPISKFSPTGSLSFSIEDKALYETPKREYNYVSVKNSGWDGSVLQVKRFLKKTLKDPKSYEGIEWSEVQSTEEGYVVRHKYRAKNSFGGYVVENNLFYLDKSGNVINIMPFNP